uniref:BEL1 n=1 Tax=Kalanchoe x houghtonii TaxID=291584 RepID=B2MV69_9MAGN|nr:BEL1 [Kalanchoe x houghtonii]
MAAYFDGGNSQIQAADGLQTLIFMNPSYVNNHHHQNPNNFVFANPSMSPATDQSQQLVGVPLQQTQHPEPISALHGLVPRPHYNLWTPIVRDNPRPQKGLSLSLSNSQQQVGFAGTPPSAISPSSGSKDDGIGTPSPASVISNGPASGLRSVLLCSKYLKATQQLLEEVVNVGSAMDSAKKKDTATGSSSKAANEASSPEAAAAAAVAVGDGENGGKKAAELSTAERHEIQMKKGKLVCMLDGVELRYRQYQQQMQIVIASFEQAAGQGSARTYTALALRTISRQFRCLKDAIVVQMRAMSKSLGEEEDMGIKEGVSRLKFVDHHLRQQRALQQLGMIQHNAWRPQRGLPERSVLVLRAWLFEHFLHPYPKDSDKQMLAKQAGLTRSQVSNWFINARVRLWKPMVEEMYNEEVKEQDNHESTDKTGISGNNNAKAYASKVPTHDNISFKNVSPEDTGATAAAKSDSVSPGRLRNQNTGFSLVGSSELEGISEMSPKRQRTNHLMINPTDSFQSNMEMKSIHASNEHVLMQFGIERQTRDDYSLMAAGPFGSCPLEEINQFDSSHQYQPRFSGKGGVSLTLGLTDTLFPNQNMRRMDTGEASEFGTINNNPNPARTTSTAYESINIQNPKRFPVQLLPDFVA